MHCVLRRGECNALQQGLDSLHSPSTQTRKTQKSKRLVVFGPFRTISDDFERFLDSSSSAIKNKRYVTKRRDLFAHFSDRR